MRLELREDYPGELAARHEEVRKGIDDAMAQAIAQTHASATQPAPSRSTMRASRDIADAISARFAARQRAIVDGAMTIIERRR